MNESRIHRTKTRRMFLKNVSLAGLSSLFLPRFLSSETSALSRAVITADTAATSGSTINASVVHSMITSSVRSLAQVSDVGEAWKTLLPGVTTASRIGIKVNCINSSLSSHPAVANAIASTLQQMMFGGIPFPANNIIIFDRTAGELQSAGYVINTSSTGVRRYATDSAGVGYSTQTYDVAGSSQRLSKIVTDTIDFLINLAVLKNHGDAGVTLCLKNHYGTCNNPGAIHGGNCNPYIGALNNLAPIRTKQKVNIIDALYGIRSGGPGGPPQFAANTIIMSADVATADYWGRKLLTDNGATTTSYANHVDTAATTYGLGTNNPSNMEVIRLSNPSATGDEPVPIPNELHLHQNYPNPFNPSTNITFDLVRTGRVELRVLDMAGREVATLIDGSMRAGQHTLVFDGSGRASGAYLCVLEAEGSRQTQRMMLVK